MTVKRSADLTGVDDPRERGFLDGAQEAAGDVVDFFTGVSSKDVADGKLSLDDLTREDRIELLIDGETQGFFSSSPWSVGAQLDRSVSDQIHKTKGSTLVFKVTADFVDAVEAKARAVRYALVWDDAIVSETGVLDVSIIGSTFLVVTVKDEPVGQALTMWVTDDDVKVTLVRQGLLNEAEAIRKEVIGSISGNAEKDDDTSITGIIGGAFNSVAGFITTSQVGGLVALAVVGVVLVLVVRSEGFKDVAKTAAKVV